MFWRIGNTEIEGTSWYVVRFKCKTICVPYKPSLTHHVRGFSKQVGTLICPMDVSNCFFSSVFDQGTFEHGDHDYHDKGCAYSQKKKKRLSFTKANQDSTTVEPQQIRNPRYGVISQWEQPVT